MILRIKNLINFFIAFSVNSILDNLLGQLEKEDGGELLVATLCLLEASAAGLLESELRTLLADEAALKPPSPYEEKGEK